MSLLTRIRTFEVQSRKELLTPVLLHSQLSHTFSTLVPFHLSSTLSLSCPSLISAFRQPDGPHQTCLPESRNPRSRAQAFRMNTAGVQASPQRELLDCE